MNWHSSNETALFLQEWAEGLAQFQLEKPDLKNEYSYTQQDLNQKG